ncbi:sugar transferase [Amorphus sp. MBR-141]
MRGSSEARPFSASAHANPTLKGKLVLVMLRLRYQLVLGVLVASILPAAIRNEGFLLTYWDGSSGRNTMLGTAIAVCLGIYFFRQLSRFPGVSDTYHVLPSFFLSYTAVILIFFLFRLEYSRSQFVVSFAISCVWYFLIYLVARRYEIYRIAVLPNVSLEERDRVLRVEWVELTRPELPDRRFLGVVADLRHDVPEEWERFVADCALADIPVFHVKQAMESLTGRVQIEHLSENTLGSLVPNRAYLRIKGFADWIAALAALLPIGAMLLVFGVLIRLETRGPALFRQTRTGYRAKPFTVYKLRTMVDAGPAAANPDAALTRDSDPRITRLGRFLRRTRIDELPQIINVLRGEMSWIGPRPEAKVLSDQFETSLPFYRYRYIVRPGITGWAQVNQGHVTAADQMLEKLHYDFFYIKNFSLWLDVLIVFRTIKTIWTGFGAR